MLKSCCYCGRVHDTKIICPKKPTRKKYKTEQNKFRSSYAWTKKAKKIKERDMFLCQICIRKRHNTARQYQSKALEVHHIVPLEAGESLRLENRNLITLCEYHHELAERGGIPKAELIAIAEEQERHAYE